MGRRTIGRYYRDGEAAEEAQGKGKSSGKKNNKNSGLPPGLAKKDKLPPGLRKQLDETGALPSGLAITAVMRKLIVLANARIRQSDVDTKQRLTKTEILCPPPQPGHSQGAESDGEAAGQESEPPGQCRATAG